jgi:hypothetical protein
MFWLFWDRPQTGIADFCGIPHVFECQFSEADDEWTDLFWLREVDERLFTLAEEQHAIFSRWRAEFAAGATTLETHPALPSDRPRYDELTALIGDGFAVQPEHSKVLRGSFSLSPEDPKQLLVTWSEPAS